MANPVNETRVIKSNAPKYMGIYGGQTPESMRQIDILDKMLAQGAIFSGDYNNQMAQLLGTDFVSAEKERKMAEKMRNLQLGQLFAQTGDTVTGKFYGKRALPDEILAQLPNANREPQGIERILAFLNTRGDNSLGGAIKRWQSPVDYGFMKSDPNQGDFEYLLNNLIMGGDSGPKENDLTKLAQMYNNNFSDSNNTYKSIYQQ